MASRAIVPYLDLIFIKVFVPKIALNTFVEQVLFRSVYSNTHTDQTNMRYPLKFFNFHKVVLSKAVNSYHNALTTIKIIYKPNSGIDSIHTA